MIDIESKVYTEVYNAIIASNANANVKSVEDYTPKVFPTVTLVEIDKYTHTGTTSSSSVNNHLDVTYELTVYTEGTSSKKNAKTLFAVGADVLSSLNFEMFSAVPMATDNYYRIVGRFRAVTDGTTIYRRQ